jgi:hypothetical protein
LIVSNGLFTANHILLGPIVNPYTYNNFSGGISSDIFQPAYGTNVNAQIYIQIKGKNLNPNGNFFDIKEIVSGGKEGMNTLSYKLLLQSNSSVVI